MTYPTILSAKVAARNKSNTLLKSYVPRLVKVLTPFLQKKVVLISKGGFAEKVKAALEAEFGELPCNGKEHIRIYADSFWDGYNIKISVNISEYYNNEEMGRKGHTSAESIFYVCETDNQGTLTKFNEMLERHLEDYRTDYDAAKIAETREQIKALEKQAGDLKSSIHWFGDYDRY